MALASATRLGPYTITASIGAGGMGEIYKATDTRLDRPVAIKILPEHVASDPELRQRFEREAKTLAALSHPHICPVFDVGQQDGIDFLVMEYLDGETLEQRLKKGALSLDQALQIGIQIADALAAAHRAGIIHRDLKPGNIMLTKSGAKLLDFGLAKTSAPAVAGSLSILPTTPPNLTAQGTILGTFQYMAPEQLEGHEADARSDIFAFGVVMYEAITGKKAFDARSQASLIAAILEHEPPLISASQPLAPPALDRVVKKCLAKTPEHRWQTARDLLDELRWVTEGARDGSAVPVARGTSRARVASWTLAVVSTAAAIAFGVLYLRTPSREMQPVRFAVVPPQNVTLTTSPDQTVAVLSPDGRQISFVADSVLWVRALDTLEARPLSGTIGAALPFWSPDGQKLGFFSRDQLMTIDHEGGPLQSLCGGVINPRGGTWNDDGEIVFAAFVNGTQGLFKVSAAGGEPTLVTKLDTSRGDLAYRYPSFLPDGRRFLFFASPTNTIWLGSLDSNQTTRLLNADSQPDYGAGYLLFRRQDTLFAQPFDAQQANLTGDVTPLAQGIAIDPNGYASFSVSDNGVLAYRTGGAGAATELRWFGRTGNRLGIVAPPRLYRNPVLSPDTTRLAVEISDPQTRTQDIWLVDLGREVTSRFTFDAGNDMYAVWSPDGRQIIFSSDREGGVFNLYQKRADGVGNEQPVSKSTTDMVPYSWSPDGSAVVYRTRVAGMLNLGILPFGGDRKPYLFDPVKATQATGQVSPDGHWLAYHSAESGRYEVYVQSFPVPGAGKWQISKDGAANARWRGDGRELFYYALDGRLMAVPITGSTSLQVGVPIPLFPAPLLNGPTPVYPFRQQYDVTRDGQRFLLNVPAGESTTASSSITVVINWQSALGARERR